MEYRAVSQVMKMKEKTKEKLEDVEKNIDEVLDDADVPNNVKEMLRKAKGKMESEDNSPEAKLSRAVYFLNQASEDINIPFHTRTDIMNITSQVEKIKEKVK